MSTSNKKCLICGTYIDSSIHFLSKEGFFCSALCVLTKADAVDSRNKELEAKVERMREALKMFTKRGEYLISDEMFRIAKQALEEVEG